MNHQNTIPSVLGPMSGPARPRKLAESEETSPLFRLAFLIAVGVVVFSAFRYLTH
jgi:hypothetical protein